MRWEGKLVVIRKPNGAAWVGLTFPRGMIEGSSVTFYEVKGPQPPHLTGDVENFDTWMAEMQMNGFSFILNDR